MHILESHTRVQINRRIDLVCVAECLMRTAGTAKKVFYTVYLKLMMRGKKMLK